MKIFNYSIVFIFVFLFSCTSDKIDISNSNISVKDASTISTIPFANDPTLSDIARTQSNVPYKIAR